MTYSNECYAAAAGVNVDYMGECYDTPPELISAVSRKMHDTSGNLDINLPLQSAYAGVECRVDGLTTVILRFSEPVQAIDGTIDETEISLSAGTLQSVSLAGPEMNIEISGVPDQSCLRITVTGISDLTGNPLIGYNDVHIHVLLGDAKTEDNDIVNIFDLGKVKSQLFKPVTLDNYMCDVNMDGIINIFDLGLVKSNLFKTVSCP